MAAQTALTIRAAGLSEQMLTLQSVAATPLRPAWTMMLVGLAGLSFAAHRRKRNGTAFGSATFR